MTASPLCANRAEGDVIATAEGKSRWPELPIFTRPIEQAHYVAVPSPPRVPRAG